LVLGLGLMIVFCVTTLVVLGFVGYLLMSGSLKAFRDNRRRVNEAKAKDALRYTGDLRLTKGSVSALGGSSREPARQSLGRIGRS
jgi:hypothetical protein